MYKLLTLAFVLLICFGCDDDQMGTPDVPENIELDIDQDGNSEFTVTYFKRIEGDPVGNYQVIRMDLESTDNDQILINENEFPIFLDDIDLIQTQVNSPLYWEVTNPSPKVSFPIARIRTDYDETTWNDTWSIFSSEEKESYLIGIKLLGNNTTQLGYIEFSVDSQTGEFILLRTELL